MTVPVYDAERSIADIIRERAKGTVNPQLVRDAMVGYFRKDDRDLPAREDVRGGGRGAMSWQKYLEDAWMSAMRSDASLT